MSFRRLLPVAVLLVCATLPLTFADQVVYFVNGKAIMVKSVEKGDKLTILEMEGGGKIGVPTEQIVKIEEFMVTAPQAPPVVPVQTAPAPVPPAPIAAVAPGPVTAPPAFASGVPAAPLMAPGPGMGGKPAGGPNDNLARVQPLDVGGNNNGGPMQRQYPQGMAGPRSAGPGAAMLGPGPRANLPPGGRRFGRGFPAGGRGGRTDNPAPAAPPQTAQPAPQPQATQPAAAPTPEPAVEPEAPPAPPDDSNNEEPPDPPAPEQGDSSGNTPGGAN